VVLGNHDLHLLALAYGHPYRHHTLHEILKAEDCEDLISWLRQQPLLHYDADKNYLMIHAGLTPRWDLQLARACAKEVETILQDNEQCPRLLQHMYGDQPDDWSSSLRGWDRYRYIINVFTRIRFCDAQGRLILHYKGTLESKPPGYVAWFDFPKWRQQNLPIIFGHWAALNGITGVANIIALDTGCAWGNELTAFCLETSQRFAVRSNVKNS
jgi:bis(5'-nucleosyl)-tetraphosphatase (symmetrical)